MKTLEVVGSGEIFVSNISAPYSLHPTYYVNEPHIRVKTSGAGIAPEPGAIEIGTRDCAAACHGEPGSPD
jgi:hypothetical protein